MTIIDPDQLRYAEQKFPEVQFTTVPFEDLGKCEDCVGYFGPADAQVRLIYSSAGHVGEQNVCDGCLEHEINFLKATHHTKVLRVEAPLREEMAA